MGKGAKVVKFVIEVTLPEEVADNIADASAGETWTPSDVAAEAIGRAVGCVTWRRVKARW